MGMDLFGETSESDEQEDISQIKINEEFARRFEYNKKREDLQRLEELKKQGHVEDSEGSSLEDEEESYANFAFSAAETLQFCKALDRVKKKDPSLYQKDVRLFDSEDENDENKEKEKPKYEQKKKSLYLKDVLAKQLIEEGPEFEEETRAPVRKSYLEEQEVHRKAFLTAVDEAFEEDQDDLLAERKVGDDETIGDGKVHEIERICNGIFEGDAAEAFLNNYIKSWASITGRQRKPLQGDICGVSEDEDQLDKQDKYESEYNFRFEENVEDRVLGHARFSDTSVRKKLNARKIQRKSKEERMAHAEFERREELKHLKNVKKKEIMDKLEKIRSVAGIAEDGACALDADDLDEEFDPEEFDRKMKETFDDDYYDANDVDPNFQSDDGVDDLEKPAFDKEDELRGLPKDWDLVQPGDGFLAARENIQKFKQSGLQEVNGENAEDGVEALDGKKRKSKGKISFQDKFTLDKELEEYYKLDYEDTIGDLKTRFKYTSVPSMRYGLSSAEILMTDDKELNQYVSLKKLAPYRPNEYKVSKSRRYSQKMRMRLALQGNESNAQKVNKKKHSGKDKDRTKTSISGLAGKRKTRESEEQTSEVVTLSKRSRKRRRHAALKIAQPRLVAYGIIPPKSKIRKTH